MIILIRVLNEYQIIIDSSVPLKNNGKKKSPEKQHTAYKHLQKHP